MMRLAKREMSKDLAELRRVCFHEDDTYIHFYLYNRFIPNNTLVYKLYGQVVASLTLLPVTIVTPGRNFPAAYVYAVSTLPEHRRRGLAADLLEYAETVMSERGAEALLLAPASEALAAYYAKFGYQPCFYRKRTDAADSMQFAVNTADCPLPTAHCEPLLVDDFLRLRDAAFAQGGYFVRWDKSALHYALLECKQVGGLVCRLRAGAEEGFFAAYPENGTVVVKESVLTSRLLPHALRKIKQHFGQDKPVTFYQAQCTPPADWTAGRGETEHFAMLKCLTPNAFPVASAAPYFGLALD